jgi:DNA-binding NtrC family response regulator
VSRILLVDDEPNILKVLGIALANDGHSTTAVLTAEEALHHLAGEPFAFDLLLTDVRLGAGMDGLALLQEAVQRRPNLPVLVMTAYGTIELAVEAMKLGASDFIRKPFKLAELQRAVATILAPTATATAQEEATATAQEATATLHHGRLIGESPVMRQLYERLEKVAKSDANVLIEGESGTGKELAARAIHQLSRRRQAPWIALNCAALPANLLESEMFGHAAGAFTGATHRKDGLFLAANHGTLFLDEIGTLEFGLQSKLLRAIQERRVRRIGETEDIPIAVRVIAATNDSLETRTRAGTFREDLFYRLCVIPIEMPPLRRRAGDIPLLVRHFLDQQSRELGHPLCLEEGVMPILERYPWPGNIRELGNAIACAAALCHHGAIRPEDLPPRIAKVNTLAEDARRAAAATPASLAETPVSLRDYLRNREREYMELVLHRTGGNRVRAAELLGISRATLYRKLEGLDTLDEAGQ